MTLNIEQINRATATWRERDASLASRARCCPERAGAGPYHLLVAVGAPTAPYVQRKALEAFPGVPIAYLCALTHTVLTGQLSLHVVPALVYEEVVRCGPTRYFHLDADLEPVPFAAPPTEGDLARVFINAMSGHASSSTARFRRHLGFRAACDALGWRTVAALVNDMDEATRASSCSVLAVLKALSSSPGVSA